MHSIQKWKTGGWVSENYLAALQLLTWMYSCLHEIAPDATFQEPNIEQVKWTLKENQQRLLIGGLEASCNEKNSLRQGQVLLATARRDSRSIAP
jgi:hypothetical protein